MVRHHQPRKGSVAFSPRKRAAKETPRIKSWPQTDDPQLLGLAGYKDGMTHALVTVGLILTKTLQLMVWMFSLQ